MRQKPIFAVAGPALLLLCACSPRLLAVRATADLIDRGSIAFYEESDPRLAKDAMPAQLKLAEVLLRSDPKNPELLKSLCEGYVGYAFLFLEDEEPERAKELYRRALDYGLRLAALEDDFAGLATMQPEKLDAVLKEAERKDVPGLYWTAYAWAGLANLAKDEPEALSGMPKAARMMARVLELDPAYQFGGADLFFGVYYAARPKLAGGDLPKAKSHFEAAMARRQGRFLTAHLLYARYYAVAALDDQLFRQLNEKILASPAEDLPEARLANEVAKLKAKKQLEKIDELF